MSPVRIPIFAVAALVAALFLAPCRAAPLWNYPTTLQQPDGSSVRVYLNGDEFVHWATDARGYTVMRHPDTGFLVYAARNPDGSLRPTLWRMGRVRPEAIGLAPRQIPSMDADGLRLLQAREAAVSGYRARRSHNTGSFNNIVVLIRFRDEPASAFAHTSAQYDAMFNGAPGTNSLRSYYQEVSYNALTINSVFYPSPSGGAMLSFQDAHPRAYYMPYDAATNPIGYQSGDESGQREKALLQAAVAAVAPQIVAAAINVDVDHDATVDSLVFVLSGDASWGGLFWPHMYWLSDATIAGAATGAYDVQMDRNLFEGGAGVSSLAHEMFHTLGAPDLYHGNGDGVSPAGIWDLMDGGANPPPHMLAYMKWKYGGWLPSLPQITASGHFTLQPATSPGCVYQIPCTNSLSQSFVVEYRQKSGVFESSIPASGLIVYRVNPSITGNAGGPPDEVYVYRPGGTLTANGDLSSAPMYSPGRTAMNAATNPSPFLQDDSPGLLDVQNVGAPGSTIAFDVNVVYPPASHLGFLVQPGSSRPGQPFTPAVQVAALTDIGMVTPAYTGTVTLSLLTGTGSSGASLGGTTTAPLVNGRATFSGVCVSQAGADFVLRASTSGMASGDSAPFSVTPSGASIERVDLSNMHADPENAWAQHACLSADGRFAAFRSNACNLAPNDTNGLDDIFVKDLATGAITRATAFPGGDANASSDGPVLSSTGAYLVFETWANNLVPDDRAGYWDVMLRDMAAGTTERVSLSSAGGDPDGDSAGGAVSADGRYVAFQSNADNLVAGDTNGYTDIFVRDRVARTTVRISTGYDGSQANGNSNRHVTMSDDGNFVCFQSDASNLVPNDTNGRTDVFVWSRATGKIERIGVSTGGAEGNGSAWDPVMSQNGRYVVFTSDSNNLVSNDNNGVWDVFLRDRVAGTTERVSLTNSGGEGNSWNWASDVSPDGRYVSFASWSSNLVDGDTNGTVDIFLRDRQAQTTMRLNVSASGLQANAVSDIWCAGHNLAAGPKVAYRSDATNLVPGDVNCVSDVLMRDLSVPTTVRLSAGPNNYETGGASAGNGMVSGDGRYLVFQSDGVNLVPGDTNGYTDVFLRDTLTGTTERVSLTDTGGQANGDSADPAITPDARFVVFASWAGNLVKNGRSSWNIYVRDRQAGHTYCVSDAPSGSPNGDSYRPGISADGTCVAFVSTASNLMAGDNNGKADWFWRNRITGEIKRISVPDGGGEANDRSDDWLYPSLSADGRYVAFPSDASNLVPNDTNNSCDVFVYDTELNHIECVSVDATGRPGDNSSIRPAITPDGRFVAFSSWADNLVPGDTNWRSDVFVRDRLLGKTTRIDLTPTGAQTINDSFDPAISDNGRYVAYKSGDGDLVPNDYNGQWDVFVTDTTTRATVRVSEDDFGAAGNGESQSRLSLSSDGRFVAFQGYASNLVPNDVNSACDIFVRGPLWNGFTLRDVVDALRYAGGALGVATPERTYLDLVSTPSSTGRVDLPDAVALALKVAGLEANP